MRNEALSARRELQAHRRFVTGVTASTPAYKAIDGVGNKEWVVDVYIGADAGSGTNIVKDVIVASTARQIVAKMRLPVLLERSKQGKYTVVGRADTMPAGAQMPEGSILEPTYHRNEYNLAELGTQFIADISYAVEKWGDKVWGDGGPWQDIRGVDAFGNLVLGNSLDPEDIPDQLSLTPISKKKTRHVLITVRPWGNVTDGLRWGVDAWGATLQKVIEQDS